jgi:transcriptional regulator with GAF, ATPase, and Fis domain
MIATANAEGRRMEAWLHFLGEDRSAEESVRTSLSAAGVLLCEIRASHRVPHGVACLSEVDDKTISILREVCENQVSHVIALITSPSELPLTRFWEIINAGASETVVWKEQGTVAKQIYAKLERWAAIDELVQSAVRQLGLVGDSPGWVTLLRMIAEAAHFTDAPILLMGDSGTGKELLARLIHVSGPWPQEQALQHELITLDCSTIVPELSGSELFGHERGAFTHAISSREGVFALADGGTLFLDEVGELPLALQAQLLRAVQEKSYKKVGSNVWHRTDFRLVCATNRDLAAQVERGQFRLDLYHRISGWIFRTLPLDRRRQDILPLATHFLSSFCSQRPVPDFDSAVRDYLVNRDYPGNVRELYQLIRRIAHRHVGNWPITLGDIPPQDIPSAEMPSAWPDKHLVTTIGNALALGIGLRKINQVTTDTAIRLALSSENGNLPRAAHRLGVTDRALQHRRASAKLRDQSSAA